MLQSAGKDVEERESHDNDNPDRQQHAYATAGGRPLLCDAPAVAPGAFLARPGPDAQAGVPRLALRMVQVVAVSPAAVVAVCPPSAHHRYVDGFPRVAAVEVEQTDGSPIAVVGKDIQRQRLPSHQSSECRPGFVAERLSGLRRVNAVESHTERPAEELRPLHQHRISVEYAHDLHRHGACAVHVGMPLTSPIPHQKNQ